MIDDTVLRITAVAKVLVAWTDSKTVSLSRVLSRCAELEVGDTSVVAVSIILMLASVKVVMNDGALVVDMSGVPSNVVCSRVVVVRCVVACCVSTSSPLIVVNTLEMLGDTVERGADVGTAAMDWDVCMRVYTLLTSTVESIIGIRCVGSTLKVALGAI